MIRPQSCAQATRLTRIAPDGSVADAFRKVPLDEGVEKDPEVEKEVQASLDELAVAVKAQTGRDLREVVGETENTLEGVEPAVRGRETALGNFLTDVLRERMKTDVAFAGLRGASSGQGLFTTTVTGTAFRVQIEAAPRTICTGRSIASSRADAAPLSSAERIARTCISKRRDSSIMLTIASATLTLLPSSTPSAAGFEICTAAGPNCDSADGNG